MDKLKLGKEAKDFIIGLGRTSTAPDIAQRVGYMVEILSKYPEVLPEYLVSLIICSFLEISNIFPDVQFTGKIVC